MDTVTLDSPGSAGREQQELAIIRNMIEKTRRDTIGSGWDFIMWGWLVFAASILSYVLIARGQAVWTWLPWVVLMPLGAVVSAVRGFRTLRRGRVVTYTLQALAALWQACGIAFLLIGFVAIPLGDLPVESLLPLFAIIAGIGTYVAGGIIEWPSIRYSGIVWWTAAVVMMLLPWQTDYLVLALTIFPGYLWPGYSLRRQLRRA
jgi:hypothetical protein